MLAFKIRHCRYQIISNNETLLAIAMLKIMQKYACILKTLKNNETKNIKEPRKYSNICKFEKSYAVHVLSLANLNNLL